MLQIAKILKSHGTDGGVLIGLRAIEPQEISLTEPVFIYFDGLPVPFFIEGFTQRGSDKIVAHLTDVRSLDDAEELCGREVYVDSETSDDESEYPDFAGWMVQDKGVDLGLVSDCEPIPGNFCLYVQRDDEEIMVPLAEDLVISIDEENGVLNLDLPSGLY